MRNWSSLLLCSLAIACSTGNERKSESVTQNIELSSPNAQDPRKLFLDKTVNKRNETVLVFRLECNGYEGSEPCEDGSYIPPVKMSHLHEIFDNSSAVVNPYQLAGLAAGMAFLANSSKTFNPTVDQNFKFAKIFKEVDEDNFKAATNQFNIRYERMTQVVQRFQSDDFYKKLEAAQEADQALIAKGEPAKFVDEFLGPELDDFTKTRATFLELPELEFKKPGGLGAWIADGIDKVTPGVSPDPTVGNIKDLAKALAADVSKEMHDDLLLPADIEIRTILANPTFSAAEKQNRIKTVMIDLYWDNRAVADGTENFRTYGKLHEVRKSIDEINRINGDDMALLHRFTTGAEPIDPVQLQRMRNRLAAYDDFVDGRITMNAGNKADILFGKMIRQSYEKKMIATFNDNKNRFGKNFKSFAVKPNAYGKNHPGRGVFKLEPILEYRMAPETSDLKKQAYKAYKKGLRVLEPNEGFDKIGKAGNYIRNNRVMLLWIAGAAVTVTAGFAYNKFKKNSELKQGYGDGPVDDLSFTKLIASIDKPQQIQFDLNRILGSLDSLEIYLKDKYPADYPTVYAAPASEDQDSAPEQSSSNAGEEISTDSDSVWSTESTESSDTAYNADTNSALIAQ